MPRQARPDRHASYTGFWSLGRDFASGFPHRSSRSSSCLLLVVGAINLHRGFAPPSCWSSLAHSGRAAAPATRSAPAVLEESLGAHQTEVEHQAGLGISAWAQRRPGRADRPRAARSSGRTPRAEGDRTQDATPQRPEPLPLLTRREPSRRITELAPGAPGRDRGVLTTRRWRASRSVAAPSKSTTC